MDEFIRRHPATNEQRLAAEHPCLVGAQRGFEIFEPADEAPALLSHFLRRTRIGHIVLSEASS
jgi:hypothetical protein